MMHEVQIDSGELINMVRERPVIWDRRLDIHKNRSLTKSAWEEICEHFAEEYGEMCERDKKETVKAVMSKWNNIRDNWMRCRKRWKDEMESGVKTRRKYLHHDRLLFLENAVERREENFGGCRERGGGRGPHSQCEPRSEEGILDRRMVFVRGSGDGGVVQGCLLTPPPSDPLETLATVEGGSTNWKKSNWKAESNNRPYEPEVVTHGESNHQSFFLSVMPMMEDFEDEETLEFRMAVLQSISNIKKKRRRSDLGHGSQYVVPLGHQFPALPRAFPHLATSPSLPGPSDPWISNVRR